MADSSEVSSGSGAGFRQGLAEWRQYSQDRLEQVLTARQKIRDIFTLIAEQDFQESGVTVAPLVTTGLTNVYLSRAKTCLFGLEAPLTGGQYQVVRRAVVTERDPLRTDETAYKQTDVLLGKPLVALSLGQRAGRDTTYVSEQGYIGEEVPLGGELFGTHGPVRAEPADRDGYDKITHWSADDTGNPLPVVRFHPDNGVGYATDPLEMEKLFVGLARRLDIDCSQF